MNTGFPNTNTTRPGRCTPAVTASRFNTNRSRVSAGFTGITLSMNLRLTYQWRWLRMATAGVLFGALLSGCIQGQDESTTTAETSASPMVDPAAEPGVAIPSDVRKNLGVTFATVERRAVEENLRVPGVFELKPGARHEYRALLAGHLRLSVEPFQAVSAGDLLFSIDSPGWRKVQHEAVEAEGEIKVAQAALRVARTRLDEARTSAQIAQKRVDNLASVDVRNASLEAEAAALEGSLLRLQAEVDAAAAGLEEAKEHYHSRLNTLSSIASIPVEDLLAPGGGEGHAAWRAITELEVRARENGVVEEIPVNDGTWLEANTLALTILDPKALRFVGKVPQSQLGRVKDGASCTIVPPQGGTLDIQDGIPGTLKLALTAHNADRTLPVYVTPASLMSWAKAGVSAYLEIPEAAAASELAIPVASLVEDGLDTIFFRRSPKDPNRALPVKADLGPSDGRWVVVRSGVKAGDEVVLDGAYALKLAGGNSKAPEGYHYHADGSLHKNH